MNFSHGLLAMEERVEKYTSATCTDTCNSNGIYTLRTLYLLPTEVSYHRIRRFIISVSIHSYKHSKDQPKKSKSN